MHIIIPMSGISKRFTDNGYTIPKFLIEIEQKPMIEHVINLFPNETKFTFICNNLHLKTTNIKNILYTLKPNCNLIEVDVNNKKGPVDAVLQATHLIENDEEIIVSYCDYGTKWNYNNFKKEIKDKNVDGAIACYRGFHPHMLGTDNYAFVKEENNHMIEIQEKKQFTNNRMTEYASNGTYYFKSGFILKKYFQKLIDLNQSINNEFYVSMVYNLMKKDNLNIYIFEIEKMLQWGTPKDLEEYLIWSDYFLKRDINFNKKFVDNCDTTLILPMAGAGSRFFNEGYVNPKPLLNIEDKPMIINAIECLPDTKNKIFICQNSHLKKYKIDDNIKFIYPDAKILGIDNITEGQASTCELAFNNYDIDSNKPLMISACDNGVYYDIDEYEKLLKDNNVDIIIWSFSNNPTSKLYPNMYAWLDVDKDNYIKRVSIKKPFNDCENRYAIIGTMYFKKASYFLEGLQIIYEKKIKTNNEYYVDNMIEPLIKKGYKCKIFDVKNYLCWGTPNDYKTYNYWCEYFKDKNI
jgi:NDP-sugar pyrophosphorylase family protein